MNIAIAHLHERGCRKVGCIIYGTPGSGNTDVRKAAVVKALNSKKLPAHDNLIHFCASDNYVEIIGKLLKQGIDALFCPGGNAGIVAAYALSLYNRRIPDDISLVASEHKLFSHYATPPQTTITQDHIGLAETTVNIIESFLEKSSLPDRLVLPYSLIMRDSVRSQES